MVSTSSTRQAAALSSSSKSSAAAAAAATTVPTTTTTTTTTAFRSAALTAYRRTYEKKKHQGDPHTAVLSSLRDFLSSRLPPSTSLRVLYPGCHRHITPSLYFPHVDYIDCDSKVRDVFEDDTVRAWVHHHHHHHHHYDGDSSLPTWTFTCANFEQNLPPLFEPQSYHLLISLSAGLVVAPCHSFLCDDNHGYLLVNDSHGDASAAAVHSSFQLCAVYHSNESGAGWTTNDLSDYFVTTRGTSLTTDEAQQAATIGAKAKRSYRLAKEAPFYLFQKISTTNTTTKRKTEGKTKTTSKNKKSKSRPDTANGTTL